MSLALARSHTAPRKTGPKRGKIKGKARNQLAGSTECPSRSLGCSVAQTSAFRLSFCTFLLPDFVLLHSLSANKSLFNSLISNLRDVDSKTPLCRNLFRFRFSPSPAVALHFSDGVPLCLRSSSGLADLSRSPRENVPSLGSRPLDSMRLIFHRIARNAPRNKLNQRRQLAIVCPLVALSTIRMTSAV